MNIFLKHFVYDSDDSCNELKACSMSVTVKRWSDNVKCVIGVPVYILFLLSVSYC